LTYTSLHTKEVPFKSLHNYPFRYWVEGINLDFQHGRRLLKLPRCLQQILLGLVALVEEMSSIIQSLGLSLNINDTSMAFRQIVAVGIWILAVLEYGYLKSSECLMSQSIVGKQLTRFTR
jgi:hypothetical protein